MIPLMRNRPRTILILLAITAVVCLSVDVAYRIVEINSPPETQVQATVAGPQAADAPRHPLEHYALIAERNLFRTTDKPSMVDLLDPNSLEATTLQLELYGTIAGENGKGYAIIEEKSNKRQRLFKIGDNIGGATVVKITRNAVVLRYGEKDQVLKKTEAAARSDRVGRPSAVPMPSPAPAPAPMPAPPAPMGPPGSYPIPRPPPTGIPSPGAPAPGTDLSSLMTQARITPNLQPGPSGKPEGVVITEIQPGSLFKSAGLANGDVIQEVNGRSVSGINDLMSLYRSTQPGTNLSIKVNRSGRPVELNHVME